MSDDELPLVEIEENQLYWQSEQSENIREEITDTKITKNVSKKMLLYSTPR